MGHIYDREYIWSNEDITEGVIESLKGRYPQCLDANALHDYRSNPGLYVGCYIEHLPETDWFADFEGEIDAAIIIRGVDEWLQEHDWETI